MDKRELKAGDVVQINPAFHLAPNDGFFAACFMVVTEPKGFGAVGYFASPQGPRGTAPGLAYYRATWAEMEFIGRAEWTLGADIEESGEESPQSKI